MHCLGSAVAAEVIVGVADARSGQKVVAIVMTSVVTLPIGQFVTVGGQEVTV